MPMAMHFAGSPVSMMANVHCAAATENLLALEFHSEDVPWWDDLVDGIEKPDRQPAVLSKAPDKPGLGITLERRGREAAPGREPAIFEPTPQWDKERSGRPAVELSRLSALDIRWPWRSVLKSARNEPPLKES